MNDYRCAVAVLARGSLAAACSACVWGCQSNVEPSERGGDPPVEPPAPSELATPAWPSASLVDQATLKVLPPESAIAVGRSPIPVLVPRDPDLARAAVVIVRPEFAAVSVPLDGFTFSVHGTRRAYRYPDLPRVTGDRVARGTRAFVTQNERIWSAAWIENGVAYVTEAECEDPEDSRCKDAAYLLRVTDNLAFVGGQGMRR